LAVGIGNSVRVPLGVMRPTRAAVPEPVPKLEAPLGLGS